MGYLYANFSFPRRLCSRLRPDVCDRQTSDAHHRLMSPGWGHNNDPCMLCSMLIMLLCKPVFHSLKKCIHVFFYGTIRSSAGMKLLRQIWLCREKCGRFKNIRSNDAVALCLGDRKGLATGRRRPVKKLGVGLVVVTI